MIRFIGILAAVYLAAFGAANLVWLRRGGWEGSALSAAICFLPGIAGLVLAFTSTADVTQYIARVLACMVFTPILLLFWSTDAAVAKPTWPFGVGAALMHAAAFVATIYWTGTTVTRVPAEAQATPVDAATLKARLLSLNSAAAPFEVVDSGAELVAWYRFREGDARSHAVIIGMDEAAKQVRVKERVSADGAAPKDADEANMRRVGDPILQPGRPNAQRVYGKTAQTSFIEPERLRAAQANISGRSVDVPAAFARGLDQDGMLALLAAVVTRSGWNWQAIFWGE
ncbi:MAG: hypothetical protein U0Q16_04275 [Bryobacteraceae bacterium]